MCNVLRSPKPGLNAQLNRTSGDLAEDAEVAAADLGMDYFT